MLSTKISQLEDSMARLRTENLDLRKENLVLRKRNEALQKKLGTDFQDTNLGSDINELNELERYQTFYGLAEAKIDEVNQIFNLFKNGQNLTPSCHNHNEIIVNGQHKFTCKISNKTLNRENELQKSKEIMILDEASNNQMSITPKPESLDSFVNKSRRRPSRRRESGLIEAIPNLVSSDEDEDKKMEDEKGVLTIDMEDDEDDEFDNCQESQILEIEAPIPEESEVDSDESFKYVSFSSRKNSFINVLKDNLPAMQFPAKSTTTTSTNQKPALLSQKQTNIIHHTTSSTSPTKRLKMHLIQKKNSPKENDTMPISTTNNSAEDMRPGRRRRRSNTVTNYALPSLRTKMRRDKDSFADAVLLKKQKLDDHDTEPIII